MTGRPGLRLGEHGQVSVTANGRGGFKARVSVRDQDGRVREATATGATRGAARRALERRLESRVPAAPSGITAAMTVEDAVNYWLGHRQRTGAVRRRGAVKPQTLAAYADAARLLVVPAMGAVRVGELTVGLLDTVLADLESAGQSTAQARSVLNQTLGLAVRHEALTANLMALVAHPQREDREVEVLDLEQVKALRALVRPEALRQAGKRGPNGDLRDVIDCLLGTGCRIGEVLAVRWEHVDLDSDLPTMEISGTIVEPRSGFVAKLHRQESTKSRTVRTLVLPDAVVETLRARRSLTKFGESEHPVFASRTGQWLWPNNIRTRLRAAVVGSDDLVGTTPHTLRRTVGTLVAHERGLDAARWQLGHSDPSITWRAYIAPRTVAPDLRDVLDRLFEEQHD
jgi:integrase